MYYEGRYLLYKRHCNLNSEWWSCLLYKGWFTVWGHTQGLYGMSPSPVTLSFHLVLPLWCQTSLPLCESYCWTFLCVKQQSSFRLLFTFFYEHKSVELHTFPILVQLCCIVYSCHPFRCVSIHVAGLFGLEWTLVARACWRKGALKGKQMSFSKQRFLHCMVPRTSTSMQSAPCVQSAKP